MLTCSKCRAGKEKRLSPYGFEEFHAYQVNIPGYLLPFHSGLDRGHACRHKSR